MKNTFSINIIPSGDEQRIAVMRRYRLLDSSAEKVFDNMTTLTAQFFGAPISLISLVDAETVFFKSSTGAGNVKCAGRGESLCALAILAPEVMVFEDTLTEKAVSDSTPVKQGVRFYAGAPLKTGDGFLIGTLCIAGFQPREFTGHDKSVLEGMAKVVMEQMELRLMALTEMEKQEQLMEQKDEFISIASHELKTPVTTLMASLQLLERMEEVPKQATAGKLISQSYKSLKKLNKLIGELLNMNNITSGQLKLKYSTFNLSLLLREAADEVTAAGQHVVAIDGDEQLTINADEQKITQVAINLLSNAVKYAPEAKVIKVSFSSTGQEVKVSVTDHGPGIPADKLPRIFERYYHAERNPSGFSGLGLGLYISAEIIKKHHGRIGVDSEPGKGSTFWFTLPEEGAR